MQRLRLTLYSETFARLVGFQLRKSEISAILGGLLPVFLGFSALVGMPPVSDAVRDYTEGQGIVK